MATNNSINNTILNANFTVPNGTIVASGDITSSAGNLASTLGNVTAGAAISSGTTITAGSTVTATTSVLAGTSVQIAGTSAVPGLYVASNRRIGAYISGTSVSAAGADTDGIFVDTSFAPSLSLTNAASIGLYPTFNPPAGVVITNGYGLYIAAGTAGGAGSTTTGYGLYVTHPAFGTTNYAAQIDNIRLDVNSIVATNANGALTINSDGSGALNLNTTNASGAVNIGLGTTARSINIGRSAAAHVVQLGVNNGASSMDIQAGTGNLNINSGGTGLLTTVGTLGINSGTGAMSISTDASATTVNIATGGAVKTVTLGSSNSTSATTVQSGSGALNVTSTNGTMTITSGTANLNIANDSTNQTVNFATGAGAKLVTLGTTNGASSLALKTGTADFSLASATGNIISAIDTGEINYPLQPAFLATAQVQSNVTGDGTVYTVLFATENFDQNSDYDGSSTFTAPVTGKYLFNISVTATQIGAAHTSSQFRLVTTLATFTGGFLNPGVVADAAAGNYTFNLSMIVPMTATNTATVALYIAGGTKVVDITTSSFFSGMLVA